MVTNRDCNLVGEAALDAIAVAQEKIPGNPALVGIQVSLTFKTPKGIRIITALKGHETA